jgi:adenylate kinase family enzyme
MSKIIIISGDLAAGKSALAKRLSRHFEIPYFQKSRLKEILGDEIEFEGLDKNKRVSRGAMDILVHIASRFAKVKGSVILEANFHQDDLEKIQRECSFANHKVTLLYLTGDVDVLYERFLYREMYQNRHPVHLTHPLQNLEQFTAYVMALRKEKEILPRNYIDTTNCDQEMIFAKAIEILKDLD